MSRERREALGIPIHDRPEEHVFVDGFCTCGEAEHQPTMRPAGIGKSRYQAATRRRGRPNLDVIEGNETER